MDTKVLGTTIVSLRETVGDACDLMVVDDGSPAQDLVQVCRTSVEEHDGTFKARDVNGGFSRAVNEGLRIAYEQGRDAILVNADIEFRDAFWLDVMQEDPAAIVGARLLYPNGLLQHAGIYFSLLDRRFAHIHQYGPGDLPEALVRRVGPVTGALQYIKRDALYALGPYDEGFRMGFEDVDYCVRAWQADYEVAYNPNVVAIHHESFFRGRQSVKLDKWHNESWLHFAGKWGKTNFAAFVPMLTIGEED